MTNTKLPKTGTVPPTLLAGGIAAIGGLGTLGGVTILHDLFLYSIYIYYTHSKP